MNRASLWTLRAVCILFVLFALCGCSRNSSAARPSPVQLDTAQMVNTAENATPVNSETPLREQLQAPESYQAQEQSGIVTLTIDAPVLVPNVGSVSIVKTTGVDFTQEQVDSILALLWQDETMWDNNPPLSKAQIEEQIASIERNLETLPDYQDEREYFETIRLPELRERLKTAPESAEPVCSDGKLSVEQILDGRTDRVVASLTQLSIHGDSGAFFSVRNNSNNTSVLENTRYGRLDVRKWAMLDYQASTDAQRVSSVMASFMGTNVSPDDGTIPAVKDGVALPSPAQAAATAEGFFSALGEDVSILDMVRLSLEGRSAYLIRCARNVEGVPCLLLDGESTSLYTVSDDEELPDAVWANETITLVVDESGISQVSWQSPHRLGETVVEHCTLLPFPKVMDVCANLLPLLFREKWGHISDMTSATIRIDRIEFGMARILRNQSIDEGLLIPVWAFYGSEPFTSASLGTRNSPQREPQLMLTINAIDGTVVG